MRRCLPSLESSLSEIVGSDSRLTGGPSALLASTAFAFELEGIEELFDGMNLADLAHLFELAEAGIVDQATLGDVGGALVKLADEGPSAVAWNPAQGDIYNNRTVWLREQVGAAADYLHAGRARREATTLAWHLACRSGLLNLNDALVELLRTLRDLSNQHRNTVMPDFTYLQHAQPTSLAHYLLGFVAPLRRDVIRLTELFTRVDLSPAGSGSVNGTALPISRERIASDLAFSGVVEHTRDAMWMPDVAVELANMSASPMVTAGRIADELVVWSTSEFGYFVCADAHSRSSVIMPQKKNPYGLTHIRGTARAALGVVAAVYSTQMTPTGQPDNRLLSYVEGPRQLRITADSLRLLAEILREGTFDVAALAAASATGHTYATDLCDALTVEHGLPNRVAHKIVGRAVRTCEDRHGRTVNNDDLLDAAASFGIELERGVDLERFTDPGALLNLRASSGGAGERALRELMSSADRAIDAGTAWGAEHVARTARASDVIDRARRMQ